MGNDRRLWRTALTAAVTLSLLASTSVVTTDRAQAAVTPSDAERREQSLEDAPEREATELVDSEVLGQQRRAATPSVTAASTTSADWPDESTATVEVASSDAPETTVEAGSDDVPPQGSAAALVQLEDPVTTGAVADAVEVHVADRADAEAAGVDGLVVDLTRLDAAGEPTDSEAPDGPVRVSVDYSSFADAYGGDWSSRLRLVSLPECALDTPSNPECRTQTELETVNDASTSTVSATVSLARASTLAVAASASGSTGNWSATSLSPSATWQVSAQTGDFSWSYPLRVPPSTGGPSPDLALSYSSGLVDGRIASANNQSSWVGDGWDLGSGYIERSYVPCSQDTAGGNNAARKTGDLCWSTDNATLMLNGSASALVKDAATGTWRAKSDDGSTIERLTGASNGDDDGEYWRVTTTDGVRYVFGRGVRSGSDSTPLNSAWTVPVFGNQAGEPCYQADFGSSSCTQAWRWNLEYVVDASGNTLTYFYEKETNRYGRNLGTAVSTYDRGGYLSRIEYGQREGSETSGKAPQVVEFTVAERCLPSGGITCDPAQLTSANAKSWPDVPFDLICTSTTSCPDVTSPAFFTRKRLTQITTKVLSGSTYQGVDAWALTQTYPDPGDGTDASLWLAKIGHSGTVGTTITLPDVTFQGVQMANRVDTLGDYGPPMNHYRVSSITSEAGGTTSVNYTGEDCTSGNLPAAPDSNDRRCFPVMWTPEGSFTEPVQEYFHKYLVTSVSASPNDGLSESVDTTYSYTGGAAWHYDDNPLVPAAQRTWGQFRGYATVDVVQGSGPAPERSLTRYRYFRGMDGDHLASGGSRSVSVDGIADQDRLSGFVREEITYDGVGGPEVSAEVSTPWVSPATATGADGKKATYLRTSQSDSRTTAPALPGGKRTTRTTTTYDATYGTPTQVDDQGDLATTADDLCTRTEYVRNAAANLVTTTKRVETVSVACGSTPSRPADVVSDVRTQYDGGAYGVAPTRGLVTATQVLASYSGSTPTYVTDATTTYDAIGRVTSQADALGRTTKTAYTPATGGPVTRTTVTSPDPDGTGALTAQVSVTDSNPAWGLPTKVTDPNGKVTTTTYDALGRLTAVWLPGRAQASTTANVTYAYTVSRSAPDAVTTSSLTANGTYLTSVQLYDGLLRPRQTQVPSANRDGSGRVVTDTVYDSRGLVAYENGSWYTTGTPGTAFVAPTEAIPSRTRYAYDGAGRRTVSIFEVGDHERWRTTTTYGGDRVSTDPPDGGVAETTISDARGRTTELRQYTSGAPSGAYASTTYTYDPSGALTAVRDDAGNRWTYTYDLRGRQTASTDPDKGATTKTYDDAGQVLTTTDARGTTLASTYDALGRQTSLRDGSATGTVRATWAYDTLVKGQLTSSTRYVGTAKYVTAVTAYDDGYRPLGQSVTLPSAEGALAGTYTTSYTYAADGQQQTVKLPAAGPLTAETVTTEYDEANLPEWMYGSLGWGVYVASSKYSSYGQLLQTDLGNTYSNIVDYDYELGTNRLTRTVLVRQNIDGYSLDLNYTYDDAGNTTKVVDSATGDAADTQCYTYDGLNRLASAWTPASGSCATAPTVTGLGGPAPYWKDYGVDSVGNRVSQTTHAAAGDTTETYAYPAAAASKPHAVTSVSTASPAGTATSTYAYDATGNTTTRAVAGKTSQTLTWDAEGRLATVKEGSATSSYVYSAGGDRLIRKQGGTTTVYLPGGQEVTLTTATSAVTAVRYYSFAGQSVAVRTAKAGSAVSSLVSDPHQTATVAVANVSQAVTKRRFDPYGNVRGAKPAWPGDHAFLNKPLDTTGLSAVGARYYDASIGRFISVDPVMDLASPQQWAAYSYADNNPVTKWDPTGLVPMIDGKWGSPRAAAAARKATGGGGSRSSTNAQSRSPWSDSSTHLRRIQDAAVMGAINGIVMAPYQTWSYLLDWSQRTLSRPVVQLPRFRLIPVPYDEGTYGTAYEVGEIIGPMLLTGAVGGLMGTGRAAVSAGARGAGAAARGAEVASRTAGSAAGRALVDAGKFDYLFGNVASSAHNAARSAQNAQQLARIGVFDNAVGRSLLSSHFDDVVASSNNVARTFTNDYGTFEVRDSLFAGPGGFLKFESTWQVTDDGLRLSTVIPMGGS